MLPPALAKVKQALESKTPTARTKGEQELLEELRDLDQDQRIGNIINTKTFSQITSSGNTCKCCGK
jgi:hypothetical protein